MAKKKTTEVEALPVEPEVEVLPVEPEVKVAKEAQPKETEAEELKIVTF